jgi:hypothetical protein
MVANVEEKRMKKVFVLCTILAVMSCLAWAGEVTNATSGLATKDNPVVQQDAQKFVKAPQEAPYYHNARNLLDDCTTPFPEGFETAVVPAVPACWLVTDVNADGYTWKTYAGGAHLGTMSIRYAYNGSQAANDWLFSPGVTLTAGTNYALKLWEKVASSTYPERWEIMMGSTQDIAGMTTTIQPAITLTNTTYAQLIYSINVAVTGTYYIGWHCISLADEYYLYMDDISLAEVPSTGRCCYVVNNVDMCADNLAADCATLGGSWTAGITCATDPCPPRGRCCYGDVSNPSCAINYAGDCATLSGTWTTGILDCATNPCPRCAYPSRDVEPNNGAATAQEIFCADSLCGILSAGTDYDYYKLVIPTGVCQIITIRVFADDTPNLYPFGRGLDSKLWLYGPDGTTQLGYNDDNYGTYPEPVYYDSKLVSTLLVSGTYYIAVGGYGPGPYILNVQCANGACPQACDAYVLCGTPGEEEPNNTCSDAGMEFQTVIGCDATVYGLICPSATDVDYWNVVVPPFSKMTFAAFDGEGCATTPMGCLTTQPFDVACASLAAASAGTWTLTNSGEVPWSLFMKVAGTCPSTYKLTTTCCPLVSPCDMITDIPAVMSYTTTVSTCPTDPCGVLRIPSGVYDNACAGSLYTAGPSKIFKIHTYNTGNLVIDALGVTGQDVQVMVFTDCANAVGTCVGSSDSYGSSTSPEEIILTNLPEGVYYISISFYGSSCGEMSLTISGDVVLPVEMRGEPTATAGNGSVTLDWATASETNNSRFEIARNGETVASIPTQGNDASGHSYTYTDNGLTNGTVYTYTLRTVSVDNVIATVATLNATPNVNAGNVTEYSLHQNYPNPFNPTTSIVFDMVDAGNVSLKIYNLMGQEVASLVNGPMSAGHHLVSFDAKNLPSGLYLYRLNVNGFNAEKKMLLMK